MRKHLAPTVSRIGRLSTAFIAISAAATVIGALSATSAPASYVGDDLPGTGDDGRAGETTRQATTACVEGAVWDILSGPGQPRAGGSEVPGLPGYFGRVWLSRPNTVCPLTGTFTDSEVPRTVFGGSGSALRQVPAGWEVWRFYGTGDPQREETHVVSGLTVSFAATPFWGSPSNVVTFTPHPDDSGTPVSGSPWRASTNINLHGERVVTAEGGRPTTNPPFRTLGQRCSTLRNPAAVPSALAHDSEGTHRLLHRAYDAIASAAVGGTSWRTALAAVNGRNNTPLTAPGQLIYDNGLDCTSPFEYAQFVSEQLTLDGVLQGACVVPLVRVEQQMTDGSWSPRAQLGVRYSTEYGPQNDLSAWRDALAEEVLRRSASPHLVDNRNNPTPGQPAAAGTTSYSKESAAAAAANYARCRLGFEQLFGDPQLTQAPEQPRVIIDVDIPEVFQIGGGARPVQTIRAGHSMLLCDGADCPVRTGRQPVQNRMRELTQDHLTRVRYELTFTIDGLNACRTTNPAERCDYTIDGPNDRGGWSAPPPQPAGEPRASSAHQSAASHRERRQQIDLTFYSATNPGERATVGIRNVSAEYATYSWGSTQIGVTNCQQNVDGAPLGTRQPASPGSEARRWDGAPYHPSNPPGTVTQWYTVDLFEDDINHGVGWLNAEGQVRYGYQDGDNRAAPWIEPGAFIGTETRERTVPLWRCTSGVFDDVEVSERRTIPSSEIEVRGLGSRVVIGVNQRPAR